MTQYASSDDWEENKGVRPNTHRFTPRYAREKTGKVHGGLGYITDETPDSLDVHTVLVTREGWPYDDDGNPAPPVDFLSGLSNGRDAFLQKLRYRLEDCEDVYQWGRATVKEPHEGRRSGYPHAHDGIAIVTPQSPSETAEVIRPALAAYVDANPFARQCDHEDGALTVHSRQDDEDVGESLANELTYNLVGWQFDGPNPLDGVSDAMRRFSSLLWTTGKRSVIFDKTFQTWIDRSQEDWEPDDDADSTPVEIDTEDMEPVQYVEPEPVDVQYSFPD
jgi:hypothetical protein